MTRKNRAEAAEPILTLEALARARLAADPGGVAFFDHSRAVTQASFRELILRTETWLRSHGVKRGDRIAVWMVNRIEWIALFFALARLGAVLLPVNTRYRSEEVGYLLSRSQAHRLILQLNCRNADFQDVLAAIDSEKLSTVEEIAVIDAQAGMPGLLQGIPTVPFDPWSSEISKESDTGRPEDLSVLFTTSGTTKGPKLVMHPQRTIIDHARRSATFYGFDEKGASMLAALPFCGTFGLSSALAAYAGGAPVHIMDMFEADTAITLLREHAITHMFGSDEMYRRILSRSPMPDPFPQARMFGFGAFNSSVSDFAMEACERGVPLAGLYGSSELLALFSMQPMSLPHRLRIEGGGMPVAGRDADVRIRDTHTGVLAPAGVHGEIEIRTPCAFTGYYNDPEATTQAVLHDGYFRTGDLGYMRNDGTFVFESRMGDAIRIGGFLVNPLEIEDVLQRAAGVADAQVVAVDIETQPRAVAFVIRKPGCSPTEAELIAVAKTAVAAFKVPARIWFVDDYPVTSSANGVKTQRNKLREMARVLLASETLSR